MIDQTARVNEVIWDVAVLRWDSLRVNSTTEHAGADLDSRVICNKHLKHMTHS